MVVSLDKIILLSDMPTAELQTILCNSPAVRRFYKIKNGYRYYFQFELFDGSNIQIGKYYDARFTFNPNGCLFEIIKYILPVFSKSNYSISNIHVAVDYPEDLSRYVWFEKTGRRSIRTFRDKTTNALQTVYFGRRKSNVVFAVYDKREESNTTETLWRVEARLRYPSLNNILPINLFEELGGGGVSLFPPKDSHLNRLRNSPEYIKKLSPYRRKVARKLTMESEDRLSQQPQLIYEQFRADLFASLSRYIIIPSTSENYSLWNTYDISNDLISFKYFMPET